MNITKKIREIRENKGLTQTDMGDKLGLEQSNYGRLERRGDKLTIEQLQQIASALGVTIKEILFSENGSVSEVEIEYIRKELELLKARLEDKEKLQKELYNQMGRFKGVIGRFLLNKFRDIAKSKGWWKFVFKPDDEEDYNPKMRKEHVEKTYDIFFQDKDTLYWFENDIVTNHSLLEGYKRYMEKQESKTIDIKKEVS